MKRSPSSKRARSPRETHDAAWRSPAQIATQWAQAAAVDPKLLAYRISGSWREILAELGITLLLTREYEHLCLSVRALRGGLEVRHLPMPHPSGIAVDHARQVVHIASTRNPNQIFDLVPTQGHLSRLDSEGARSPDRLLVPTRSRFFPGCTYFHDLALIDGELHANAVGHNAVVRIALDGGYELAWWPRCVDAPLGPIFGRNHLQLNSIAAGASLASSCFTASTDVVTTRRPGHRSFPVDKRGVAFDGATREPFVRGLTRPHSARLHDGRVWIANSGYGEIVVAPAPQGGKCAFGFDTVARIAGWTRGLCICRNVLFVGGSRVIPRFRSYAPGLDVDTSVCGIHAIDIKDGQVLGSMIWPQGNQVFAIDWVPRDVAVGFPFPSGKPNVGRDKRLFYSFRSPLYRGVS